MIKDILHTVSIWIIVLPLMVGIINYKGLNKDSKWIFLLVIAGLIPQILTAIIRSETPLLNISYNVYTPIEFGILYALFINKYLRSGSRTIINISIIGYVFIGGYYFIMHGIEKEFLNALVCVNNIIYMLWILLLLKEQYHTETIIIQKRNPFAWYLMAIIIYAPCTVLVFALYHYIRDQSNPVLMNLWIIQSVCNIIMYLLYSIGLLLRKT